MDDVRISRGEWLLAALLFLLAFGLRYHFLVKFPHAILLHEQDALSYLGIAQNIREWRPLGATFLPPIYPLVIAAFSLAVPDPEFAARLASICLDALVVFPLYGLARLYLPRRAAWAVGILWATFSFSLFFTPSPLSQSTYLFLLLAGTWLLARGCGTEGQRGALFAAGLFFACTYLTRPEGIAAFASGAAVAALLTLAWKRAPRQPTAGGLALYLGGFLLGALPYVFYLHNTLGEWTLTGKSQVALKGWDPLLTLSDGDLAQSTASGVSAWLDAYGGPAGFLAHFLANVKGFLVTFTDTFPLWMHAFCLLGVVALARDRKYDRLLFLAIPVLATLPVYVANLPYTNSYIYPLYPVYFIVFVKGIVALADLATRLGGNVRILASTTGSTLVGILLLLPAVGYAAFASLRSAEDNFMSRDFTIEAVRSELFRNLGRYLLTIAGPTDIIMARWSVIAHYAQRPGLTLPKGTISQVLEYARKKGVRFLVVDTVSVGTRRQELEELLLPLSDLPINAEYGLSVERAENLPTIGGYVLYRLMPVNSAGQH